VTGGGNWTYVNARGVCLIGAEEIVEEEEEGEVSWKIFETTVSTSTVFSPKSRRRRFAELSALTNAAKHFPQLSSLLYSYKLERLTILP